MSTQPSPDEVGQQADGVAERACPFCGTMVPVTYWPQHVKRCDGGDG